MPSTASSRNCRHDFPVNPSSILRCLAPMQLTIANRANWGTTFWHAGLRYSFAGLCSDAKQYPVPSREGPSRRYSKTPDFSLDSPETLRQLARVMRFRS